MKALVIDDDLISRMALTDALRSLPELAIHEAESAESAWQMLTGGLHPALCCCDVRMPGMSGIDLLRRLRAEPRLRNIPVLLVTSASDKQTVTDAIALGASGFIVKPFQSADLLRKVENLLGANLETLFEPSAEVIKRLNIAPARLAAYLDALAGQLDAASARMRSAAAFDGATLDALHTGTLTLGAHYLAGIVAGLKTLVGHGFDPVLLDDLATGARLLRQRASAARRAWQ